MDKFLINAASHIGGRSANDDCYAIKSSDISVCSENESCKTKIFSGDETTVLALFDGMGGFENGGLTAGIISREIVRLEKFDNIEVLEKLVCELSDVFASKQGDGKNRYGSTAVIILRRGNRIDGLCIGDSLCYKIFDNNAIALLNPEIDNVAFYNLEDKSQYTPALPMSNRLIKYIGMDIPEDKAPLLHRFSCELGQGDSILICSDGVAGELNNATIAAVVNSDTQTPAEELVKRAVNHNHRSDNCTAIVMKPMTYTKKKFAIIPDGDGFGMEDGGIPDLKQNGKKRFGKKERIR